MRILYKNHFNKKEFSIFFLTSNSWKSNVNLRPIDIKLIKYLSHIDLASIEILNSIFDSLKIDYGINYVTTLKMIKLFLKGKDYRNLISCDLSFNTLNLFDNLKLTLLKSKKTQVSVINSFVDFFCCIRTNRMNLKQYQKYRPLFLSLLVEINFDILKIFFSSEISSFCNNSYNNFKNIFLIFNDNNSTQQKPLSLDLYDNTYREWLVYKSNGLYPLLFQKHKKEISILCSLIEKQNDIFVKFIQKQNETFFIGSFRLIIHSFFCCLSNIQNLLYKEITLEKCYDLCKDLVMIKQKKHQQEQFYNEITELDLINIEKYLREIHDLSKISSIENLDQNYIDNDISILSITIYAMNKYMDILLPSKCINLNVNNYEDINLKLNSITLKDFYKIIKTKKNQEVKNKAMFNFLCFSQGLRKHIIDHTIDWDVIERKLIKKKAFDLLSILMFFKDISDIVIAVYDNFNEKHNEQCQLLIASYKKVAN